MSLQKYKKTQTLIINVEYWEHFQEERYIQCSDILPNPPPIIRCMQNSIGSYLEIHQEQGLRYPKIQLLFFCTLHEPSER